jgi:2-pyrone-4,6-dicarboxylate lactonase
MDVAPVSLPPTIPGPVSHPGRPRVMPSPGACDCHAHLFGPERRFPFTPGRGYTPPEAPLERYLGLLDHLGLDRGIVVQGNAHGYDNRVLLDALARAPQRLRGVAITDTRVAAPVLRDWHRAGMRGLRFHLHAPSAQPGYVRGVGLDVLEAFLPTLRDLGWVVQLLCDWRLLPGLYDTLATLGRKLPVVLDHLMCLPAERGIGDPSFQALLRLVGEGRVYAKLSAPYRQADDVDVYAGVRPLHRALVRANPERLLWGSDWPHPPTPQRPHRMPDDGRLLDLLADWVPSAADRQRILVDTPAALFFRD